MPNCNGNWRTRGPRRIVVFAMLAGAATAAWPMLSARSPDPTVATTVTEVSVPQARPIRTLSMAPLVQIRQGTQHGHACCNPGTGCGPETADAIACAMYAPGHRPKHQFEDSPNRALGADFNTVAGAKWPQPGGRFRPVTITYSHSNLLNGGMSGITVPQLQAAVEEALSVWAAVAPLNFVEVADSGPAPTAADTQYAAGSTPNLRFGHHAIDGDSGVLAHAFFPLSTATSGLAGDLHFDNGETWGTSPGASRIDFLEVCVHEIGHTLGLDHQNPPRQAIMNPFYGERFDGPGTAFLLFDDRRGITRIYGRVLSSRALFEQAFVGDFSFVLPSSLRSRLGE